jgi:hypothetical protein
MTIFSVQDETGTVAQVTVAAAPAQPIAVGDTGTYNGVPDDGTTVLSAPVSLPFTVGQVLNTTQFSVTTRNSNLADWPANGTITWTTGANASATSTATNIDGANAYIDTLFYKSYHQSRGNNVGTPTAAQMQGAIVKATDYLDQRYRFGGVKLLQTIGASFIDANAVFIEPWLTPYALNGLSYLTPSTSKQSTEWPRQGVVDFNGNTVNGIPPQIKAACAELAIRVLNGVELQPDYDSNLVGNGGVVSSITKRVGPLETVTAYDTRMGLGFFASFPQIDRMLNRAGLLNSGGGRTVIR